MPIGGWSAQCLRSNPAFPYRQRPAAGACLSALAGTFPVCFLEPSLNQSNPYSIYNTMTAPQREGDNHTLHFFVVCIIFVFSESSDHAPPTPPPTPPPLGFRGPYIIFHMCFCQTWDCQMPWRTCVPSCPLWNRPWGKWRSLQAPAPQLTRPTTCRSRRSLCPCCAATCPAGGTAVLGASRPARSAALSRLNMPVTSLATSSVSSTTTWAPARAIG